MGYQCLQPNTDLNKETDEKKMEEMEIAVNFNVMEHFIIII